MKRRKPPVVLATCLVLLLGAVAVWYKPGNAQEAPQEAPRESTETQARPEMNSKDVTSIMSTTMKPADEKPKGPVPPVPGTNKPSISMRQHIESKPVKQDGATSSQWYTDQAPSK